MCNIFIENRNKNAKFCSKRCCTKKNYLRNRKSILSYQIKRIEIKRVIDNKFRKKYNARHNACQTIKLDNKLCEICGTDSKLERHHKDYSKPHEVIILCKKCHDIETSKERIKDLRVLNISPLRRGDDIM